MKYFVIFSIVVLLVLLVKARLRASLLVFTGEIDNIKELEQFDKLNIFGETDDV